MHLRQGGAEIGSCKSGVLSVGSSEVLLGTVIAATQQIASTGRHAAAIARKASIAGILASYCCLVLRCFVGIGLELGVETPLWSEKFLV